jgi:hypothetical protein
MPASEVVQGIGGAASGIAGMFPGIGTGIGAGISLATTLASGLIQKKEAEKQAKQAANVRGAAMSTKTGPMRPEYLAKLRMDQMSALSDAPGIAAAKTMQQEQLANSLRSIKESSPNGASTVAAISAALHQGNAEAGKIAIRNEEYRAGARNQVSQDLQMLGDKGVALEDKRDQWKREGLQGAAALENAATGNKMNAINTITGAIGATGATIGKTISNQGYMNQLAGIYSDGSGKTETGTTLPLSPDANNVWGYQSNSTGLNSADAQAQFAKLKAQGYDDNQILQFLISQGYSK